MKGVPWMTSDSSLNVLDEPIIGVELADGARSHVSLCAVLARCSRGDDIEFTALQAHQQHGWYAFLVQLAAVGCHRAGVVSAADYDEHEWRAMLLALTDGDAGPWSLVVDDWTRPALLQPPMLRERIADLERVVREADVLDVLVTSKNFDVKATRIAKPEAEHWLYALVSLQTMSGYTGPTYYGIARMNGGSATRVAIGRAPGLGWSRRFVRDVEAWLRERERLISQFEFSDEGAALLWLVPWDGAASLTRGELDPFFIEVCRRVRLQRADGVIVARYKGVEATRIEGFSGGATGDLWSAASADEIFTLSGRGFDYEIAQKLLLQADYRCAALTASPDADPWFIARGLARGQGKTEGYHERVIPIPRKVGLRLGVASERERLGQVSTSRVQIADVVRRSVLYPAVTRLLVGGREKQKARSEQAREWTQAFTAEVDRVFFDALFAAIDQAKEDAAAQWQHRLLTIAWSVLQRAIDAVPMAGATRWRAVCAAESTFAGCATKSFPGVRWGD
jgi:CRISPR system Cascade subunit CasA